MMKLSNKEGIQQIITILSKLGLKEIVLCPGSRDAPLVISFHRHPNFHCTSIRDERSAAFFALGKAIESKEPVAILCTSGSAALNFAPAISEAYYQRIPLLVLTADRPKEWTDQGDGQTINQTDIYKNYIRKSYELKGEAYSETDYWHNERCLSEGFNMATRTDCGPVHFNIPLQEPLYEVSPVEEIQPKVFQTVDLNRELPKKLFEKLSNDFLNAKKVMILIGQHFESTILQEMLIELSEFENVVVLTESTSNVHHPNFIENIDRCITNMDEETVRELTPELLITMGGAVVSKRIKKLLRRYRLQAHWNIHPFHAEMDTYQSLTHAIPMNPVSFLKQLSPHIASVSSDYKKKWTAKNKQKEALHEQFCRDVEYSDFKVFHNLYQYLSHGYTLHISNSSPIRYAQLFDNKKIKNTWSNRGTSGIDGCTSTAVGAAASAPEKDFLLITGDVAFHYDINALWNEEKIDNLKIIVINNGGGGIFRIISGPNKVEEMETFFETSMKSDLKDVAKHYHWNYSSAKTAAELKEKLPVFFKKETKKTIFEIFTDPKKNPKVLDKYWQFLKETSDDL